MEREICMEKIGFIGLGIMGSPMATNLVRAGVDLTVNDLLPEAVEKLKKQGAAAADDAYIAQCAQNQYGSGAYSRRNDENYPAQRPG